MFGNKVTLTLKPPYSNIVLRNVTEIHYNYNHGVLKTPDYRVAFESNVHGTGITYSASDVVEFDATPETEKANAF